VNNLSRVVTCYLVADRLGVELATSPGKAAEHTVTVSYRYCIAIEILISTHPQGEWFVYILLCLFIFT